MLSRSTIALVLLSSPAGVLLSAAAIPQHSVRSDTAAPRTAAHDRFAVEFAPLIKKYCVACHGGAQPAAGISLAAYQNTKAILNARDVWQKVSRNVATGHMPPDGAPHPTDAQRKVLSGWIDSTLAAACSVQDPGRVTLRRLNKDEYNNTVRDLLGVDFKPADDFPTDDVGYGFDDIGDVLSISPLLMEKYLAAAEKVAKAAVSRPENSPTKVDGSKLKSDTSVGRPDGASGYILFTNGEAWIEHRFPYDGDYTFRVTAYGEQAGPAPAHMDVKLDGATLHGYDVTAEAASPQTFEFHATVFAGEHRLGCAFTNDYYNPTAPDKNHRDRNLVINGVYISGAPEGPHPLPAAYRRIFTCQPATSTIAAEAAAARKILAPLASRAYRRPATTAEVDDLVRCVKLARSHGESFDRGIQLAIEAMLVSPDFLFRVEIDPAPNNSRSKHAVSDYELATRLSYFIWSSMPDDALFALAARGVLHQPAVLEAQVRRMLADPKANALADNFAGQWLELRNLSTVSPDRKQFKDWNSVLRDSMRTETEMFFNEVVHDDRSILDFIDGKFTYVNGPLARHYGIPGITGDEFQRVALTGDERGGVLTQASVLTVTSNPTRTSPVKRGKWVLEQLLGTPPPPPPPGVGQLPDDKSGPLTGTLRQRMEQHRKNPMCASCHAKFDPIGFALENYDAVGAWRTQDGGQPIDASGTLPDGKSFNGPEQLKQILLAKKSMFVSCLTSKLMIYALGRGMEPSDQCAIDSIASSVAKRGYRFDALIAEIVESAPFRMRRGDGGLKA